MWSNFLATNIVKGERGKCFNSNCSKGCGLDLIRDIGSEKGYTCTVHVRMTYLAYSTCEH